MGHTRTVWMTAAFLLCLLLGAHFTQAATNVTPTEDKCKNVPRLLRNRCYASQGKRSNTILVRSASDQEISMSRAVGESRDSYLLHTFIKRLKLTKDSLPKDTVFPGVTSEAGYKSSQRTLKLLKILTQTEELL